MKIPIKKTHSRFLLLLLLINIFIRTSTLTISEEHCDVDDAAMSQWYSQIFQFVKSNQNTTHEKLNEKLSNLQVQMEHLNEEVEQLMPKSQGEGLNEKLHTLDVKMEHLSENLAELKLKYNGDDLKEKLHILEVKMAPLNEQMEQLQLHSNGDDLNEKLRQLEVKVEKTLQKLDELNAKLEQQVLMEESLKHLNVKMEELKLQYNGDGLNEKLHSLSENLAELKLTYNGDDLQEKLHALEVKVEQSLKHLNEKIEQLQQNTNDDIVIQRRMDGSVDFFRPWADYKLGFGNSSGEFFIGLEKLHKLTNSRPYELLVVLEDWEKDRRYAKYDQFIIGSEAEKYALKQLGRYSGSAGDSLNYELGQKFTTKDQDNDIDGDNCAVKYTGAWWYKACHSSNLNGRYLRGSTTEYAKGVIWRPFKGHYYSLKFVQMTIRPI